MEQGPELVRVVDREASPGRQGLTGDAGQGIAERPDSEPVPVQRGDGAFISSGFSPECISLCVVVSESTLKCLDDFYRYSGVRFGSDLDWIWIKLVINRNHRQHLYRRSLYGGSRTDSEHWQSRPTPMAHATLDKPTRRFDRALQDGPIISDLAGKAAIQLTLTRSWGRGRKPVSARRDHEKEKIKVAREIPFSNA